MRAGNLAGALAELPELAHPLGLEDALGLVVLLGEHGDRRFGRAGARWVGRFALERPTVQLPALHQVLWALHRLERDPAAARGALAGVASAHGLARARTLLVDTSVRSGC